MKRENHKCEQQDRNEKYGVHRLTPRGGPEGDRPRALMWASSFLMYAGLSDEVLKTGGGWKFYIGLMTLSA
jgi:hypothetical protein